jgi:hypothetical protein
VVNRAIKTRTKSNDPPPTADATARAERDSLALLSIKALNILGLDS